SADIVSMDRVVCCYPDFKALLGAAASRARRVLALSYPNDRWYVRVVIAVENLLRMAAGNGFRAFVHAPSAMGAVLEGAGWRRMARRTTLVWAVERWGRADAACPRDESRGSCGSIPARRRRAGIIPLLLGRPGDGRGMDSADDHRVAHAAAVARPGGGTLARGRIDRGGRASRRGRRRAGSSPRAGVARAPNAATRNRRHPRNPRSHLTPVHHA